MSKQLTIRIEQQAGDAFRLAAWLNVDGELHTLYRAGTRFASDTTGGYEPQFDGEPDTLDHVRFLVETALDHLTELP